LTKNKIIIQELIMKMTKNDVYRMIERYINEIGLSKEDTYNKKSNAYYWYRGSALVEVFVQDVPVSDGIRSFLRVFSYLGDIPSSEREKVYRYLLELNDHNLGVKLTIMPETDKIYATYERDIQGIDYKEVKTCIADLEWWADELDDLLKEKLGVQKTSN